ncbi:MAG: hypothetical protein BA873_00480 [Desulfobulbaceae bacterium C00003063]|nr:MAG: hypothetical protein BA873_00480 [Desulfobulbaceae bacterium C00003063]
MSGLEIRDTGHEAVGEFLERCHGGPCLLRRLGGLGPGSSNGLVHPGKLGDFAAHALGVLADLAVGSRLLHAR